MPLTWELKPVTKLWTAQGTPEKQIATCVWYARCTGGVGTPVAAKAAAALVTDAPKVGRNYPGETEFPCVSVSADAGDEACDFWIIKGDYDSSRTVEENPLDQPLKVTYNPDNTVESYFKDVEGNRAVMTSGEPFAELPKRDKGLLKIELEKNVTESTNYEDYELYLEPRVNPTTVTIDGRGYAAGTLKTTAPQLSDVKELNGIKYRTLSVTLEANAKGWDDKFESRGLFELVSGTPRRITIDVPTDTPGVYDQVPVESAWPLDTDGSKKPNADDEGAEIVLVPYDEGDFSPLT